MKYSIVKADAISGLMLEVANMINAGWMPLGGIAVDTASPLRNDTYYYQAMTKEIVKL